LYQQDAFASISDAFSSLLILGFPVAIGQINGIEAECTGLQARIDKVGGYLSNDYLATNRFTTMACGRPFRTGTEIVWLQTSQVEKDNCREDWIRLWKTLQRLNMLQG
jgi:hypothetical protein